MAEVQTNAPDQVDATAPAADAGPVIGLQDLQNAIKVIDYACEQGAFKGWATIEQVASVRGKLSAFVAAATPPEPEAPAEKPKKAKAPKAASKAPAVKKVTQKPAGAKK